MLFGEYKHNVDKKGRIFIPAKLREELGNEFMICRGIYGKCCLCVYSNDEWAKLVEKIGTLPGSKSSTVKRFLYAGAFNVECDTQGRVLIPPTLRTYAGLDTDAEIIGMDTNLEIWNTELWNKECEQYTAESVGAMTEGLDF